MTRRISLAICFLALLSLALSGYASFQADVTGTVLGEGRQPVSGARVELVPVGASPAAAAETDAAGRFSLRAPETGLFAVVVRKAGTVPSQLAPVAVTGPVELPPFVLSPGADAPLVTVKPTSSTGQPSEGAMLSGQIVDRAHRRPVSGALVWVSADPGLFVRTNAEGRFRLAVPAARQGEIEVAAAGYLPKKARIPGPQLASREATFALERAATLRGTVVDASGRPLPGAAVVAVRLSAVRERPFDPSDPVADRAAADARGQFELRTLRPEESYEIRATRTGALPAMQRVAVNDPSPQPRSIKLVLSAARAVLGTIHDPEGHPIAGAEVVVRPALRTGAPALFSASSREAETPEDAAVVESDGKGIFHIAQTPAAEVELTVRKKGYAAVRLPALRMPAAGTGPANLGVVTLRPGARLAGSVVNSRLKGLAGAQVFVLEQPVKPNSVNRVLEGRRPDAETSANGRFAIEDLAQGAPVHVVVRAPGFVPAHVQAVRPPAEEPPLLIRLERAITLQGRVVDESGAPVAGARVELHWQAFLPEDPELPVGDPILRGDRADAQGRFEMRDVPAGKVRLSAAAPGFAGIESFKVELPRPAGAGELKLVLPRGATLQGRVTTTAGEPVPAVRVGVGESVTSTGDDGSYWLEGAALGRQNVLFLHPSYGRQTKALEIQAGVNLLDLTFAPGVEVTGRVVDENGAPVPATRVELVARQQMRQYRDVTGDDGRFRLFPVVAGQYQMKAGAEGFSENELAMPMDVAGDPVADIEIALDRGAVLSGNILGLSSAELERVRVIAQDEAGRPVTAWSDGRGRYEVRPLHPGNWFVRAELSDDQRRAQVRVPVSRSDRELARDLEFGKHLTLSGQVLYAEEPLADARVSLRGERYAVNRATSTDYQGRFRLEDLEPDTYQLSVSQPRKLLVHDDRIDLRANREIAVRLETSTIGGTVVGTDGKPVAEAVLSMKRTDVELMIAAGTKADGRFRVAHMPPGSYRIEVRAQGFVHAEQQIQLAAGEARENVEIRLTPTPGARLQVRLASGAVPRAVHVLARGPAGEAVFADTRYPDAAGMVDLKSVPSGAWDLFVAAEGGAMAAGNLQVPSESLSLTLAPAGNLNVRVPALATSELFATLRLFGPGQQPFWTLGLGGQVQRQWSVVGGRGVVPGVPAGTWSLQVETPDGQKWTGVVTTSGLGETVATLE